MFQYLSTPKYQSKGSQSYYERNDHRLMQSHFTGCLQEAVQKRYNFEKEDATPGRFFTKLKITQLNPTQPFHCPVQRKSS